jgi:hypothetical protein
MFEIYLNNRRDLLVIEKGTPVPPLATSGKWRKRKKKVVRVSFEIRSAVPRRRLLPSQAERSKKRLRREEEELQRILTSRARTNRAVLITLFRVINA